MHRLLNVALAIAPDERDGEARRCAIIEELEARPGQSTAELGRSIDLSWTTTHYHVRRLEKAGLLRARRIGRTNRHFPAKGTRLLDAVAAVPVRQAILKHLVTRPTAGITQLARMIDCSPKTVRNNVRELEKLGLVEHGGQYHKRFRLTIDGMEASREAGAISNALAPDQVAPVNA